VTSVLGTGARGQVLLFTTVLLGASAVLFTIATIATEQNTQVSLLCQQGLRIRIRITVKSWIRIRIRVKVKSLGGKIEP
jgi:hypothetical protein